MTSNQVANAMNIENNRHNVAFEDETNRHNLALEDLQREANRIQAAKEDHENTYRMEQLRIQEEYNNAYLEYQKAQGERKLDIEQQLADIKDREQLAEQEYKKFMEMYNQELADIQQQVTDETKRSNLANEEIQTTRNDLTAKYNEYQNAYWNSSINLGNLKAVYDLQHNLQSYELGSLALQRDLAQLKLEGAKLELQQDMQPWNKASILLGSFGSLIGNASRAFTPTLPFLLNPWR